MRGKIDQANLRLRKQIDMMLDKWTFFATLALHMPLVEDKEVETIAADGTSLFYNPAWAAEAPREEIREGIAHCVLACSTKHHTRREDRDKAKWQKASHMVTGPELAAAGLGPRAEACDMSVEEAYESLPDENENESPEEGPQASQGGSGDDGEGQGQGAESPPEASQDDQGRPGEILDAPMKSSDSDADSQEMQAEEQKWDEINAQAAQIASGQGNMPANVTEMLERAHVRKVDWRVLLRRFITDRAATDYSWNRPNRRFIDGGPYLPSLHSEKLRPIVVDIDVSSSMHTPTVEKVWGELANIARDLNPAYVLVLQSTTIITSAERFESQALARMQTPMRRHGGTAFSPIFRYIDRHIHDDFACLIVFSDMECADYPAQAPRYPVLWINNQPGGYHATKPPFGQLLEVK